MSLCKQTEHPKVTEEIKIDSESVIELEAWPIIDFGKLDRFPPLIGNQYTRVSIMSDFSV